MTRTNDKPESLDEFKNSFYYGSRSNMNFKFLTNMTGREAAHFFQDLLETLSATLDDGDFQPVMERIYQWQVRGYQDKPRWNYDDGPLARLKQPLSQSRLALFTTSGHYVEGDDPAPFGIQGMTQAEAEARIDDFVKAVPELSVIPSDTPRARLRVRHPGYDVHGARLDPNVTFPLEHLRALEDEGVIGEVAPEAYSFVGACSQLRLLKVVGPTWVARLKEQQVDAALMVPV
jgi:hypothetical protein